MVEFLKIHCKDFENKRKHGSMYLAVTDSFQKITDDFWNFHKYSYLKITHYTVAICLKREILFQTVLHKSKLYLATYVRCVLQIPGILMPLFVLVASLAIIIGTYT